MPTFSTVSHPCIALMVVDEMPSSVLTRRRSFTYRASRPTTAILVRQPSYDNTFL